MIVDTSAIVAIVRAEPDSARDPFAGRRFDDLLTAAGISVVALTPQHAEASAAPTATSARAAATPPG